MIKSKGKNGNGKTEWGMDWPAVLSVLVQSILIIVTILATYFSTIGTIKTAIAINAQDISETKRRLDRCEHGVDDLNKLIVDRVDCQICHHKSDKGK